MCKSSDYFEETKILANDFGYTRRTCVLAFDKAEWIFRIFFMYNKKNCFSAKSTKSDKVKRKDASKQVKFNKEAKKFERETSRFANSHFWEFDNNFNEKIP